MEGLLEPEEVEETVGTVEVRPPSRPRAWARSPAATSPRAPCAAARQCAWCATARSSTTAGSARCAGSRTTSARSPQGMECGIVLENYADVKEGDVLEVYETQAGRADAGLSFFVCLVEIQLHFPRERQPEGQAQGAAVAEGAAAAALRRGRGRDRPPRPLAARDAHRRAGGRDAGAAARAATRASSASCELDVSRRRARGSAMSCPARDLLADQPWPRPHAAGQRGGAGGALGADRRRASGTRA